MSFPKDPYMISALLAHSGTFHGDDVLAYTLLRDLHPQARLVRTRDPDSK